MIEVAGADRVRVKLDAAEIDTQARPAASSTTTSSAVRPEGKDKVTVRSHPGRCAGARFW